MKTLCVLVLITLCGVPAFAKKKPKPVYQDAVLVRYQTVNAGAQCSGRVNGTVSDEGDVHANTDSDCYAIHRVHYIVTVDGQTLELVPSPTKKKVGLAMATMGYSSYFQKRESLFGQLPGTPIEIRSDGNGKFWVKLGKHESLYSVAGVE